MQFTNQDSQSKECLDFEYLVTLDDRTFVQAQLEDIIEIHKLVSLLFICEVDDKIIKIYKYVLIDVYINDLDSNRNFAIARFIAKIYLIDNLKINVLIEIDVLELHKISLDFEHYLVRIDACRDFTISINVINKINLYLKRII